MYGIKNKREMRVLTFYNNQFYNFHSTIINKTLIFLYVYNRDSDINNKIYREYKTHIVKIELITI